jgi:transposase InsO family protein
MLTTAALIRPEAERIEASGLTTLAREVRPPGESSAGTSAQVSTVEVEIHEEKVFAHLDEEKERDAGTWVLDTRAMNHMSGCQVAFTKIDTTVLDTVHFGVDSVARIEGDVTVLFVCKNGESRSFDEVYFIPRLTINIVSVDQLDEIYYKIDINTGVMKIREPGGVLLVKVKWEENCLYLLHLMFVQPTCLAVHGHGNEVAWHWHERFGHVNMAALQKLSREELVHGLPKIGQVRQLCMACQVRKQRHTSFLVKAEYRAERRLELVHGDLCGAISSTTSRGNKYFLLIVDNLNRYMWVAVIPSNDHAVTAIKDIQTQAESESGFKPKALHTNHGGEFTAMEFTDYHAAEGVHRQHTVPYSRQQNNIIERQNGTVLATARSLLKAKGLPGWFWGEAVNAVVYVLNRCLMKSIDGMTLFEAWHGRKSVVHHLRTFGCIVYVWNMTSHLKKLEDYGHKMIFVGYESGSKAYRAYDPITKRVHVTCDVVFDEQAQWD